MDGWMLWVWRCATHALRAPQNIVQQLRDAKFRMSSWEHATATRVILAVMVVFFLIAKIAPGTSYYLALTPAKSVPYRDV